MTTKQRELLTTTQAADLLGVGGTTIKRWADEGRLPCRLTLGGHRRFSPRDLARLRGGGPGDPLVREWLEMIFHDADIHRITGALLIERARLGSWWRVCDHAGEVITELGRAWQTGSCAIADEHRATYRLQRALADCAKLLASVGAARRCLLAAAEGEDHTLGLSMVELCLLEAGWTCEFLGRATPTQELIRDLEDRPPEMVAVSASSWSDDARKLASDQRKLARACQRHGVVLVMGGKGAWPDAPGYGHRLHSFHEFHHLLAELGRRRSRGRLASIAPEGIISV